MDFASPLVRARFLRREKRFFIFAELDGQEVVAHCPNTGSLKGVLEHTAYVWLLPKTGGKLRWCAEIAEFNDGTMVGIHPARANALAEEAVRQNDLLHGLGGFTGIRREVAFDGLGGNCRFDLHVDVAGYPWWVEVKSVSMALPDGTACWPDARSARGYKHLKTLLEIQKYGGEGVKQLFIVQRNDCSHFTPASHIDPDYAALLKVAVNEHMLSVEALACEVTPQFIRVNKPLEILL